MSTATKATHTPDPWTARESEGSYGYEITVPILFGVGRKPIAIALYDTSKAIALANARLIAAAPRMLGALDLALWHYEESAKSLKEFFDKNYRGITLSLNPHPIEVMRAAIQKAKVGK